MHSLLRGLGLTLSSLSAAHFGPLNARLTQLSLANNSLGVIPSAWIQNMLQLQRLDLSETGLSALEPGQFDVLAASLVGIDISRNNISVLPRGLFGVTFPNLQTPYVLTN